MFVLALHTSNQTDRRLAVTKANLASSWDVFCGASSDVNYDGLKSNLQSADTGRGGHSDQETDGILYSTGQNCPSLVILWDKPPLLMSAANRSNSNHSNGDFVHLMNIFIMLARV